MPRKRKHSDDEEEEETEEIKNGDGGGRAKRKAAMAAMALAKDAVDSDEEEDGDSDEEGDEDEEDYEGEDDDDEGGDEDGKGDDDEDDEGDEDEDVDADAIKVECVEAKLDEPTADIAGYVLTKAEGGKQKLEMWFSEEMSETVGEISEAFFTHFENKKLPVLQITKYDVIEERPEVFQIDVLEAKYDKAYDIRQAKDESNLANDFHCLVRVDEINKTWATQYFMPDED
ncbi:nucleolin [Nematostella vectensis]|uniref:nucleolin n=1 Tax=Nematostella vectensis TaxID=45351 RepID=UPI0020773B14|nr:nucleolin [Nematostella vectensis]